MATAGKEEAFGIKLEFLSTGWSTGLRMEDISWSGLGARDKLETTHQESGAVGPNQIGNREYVLSKLQSPGTLSVNVQFDPDHPPAFHQDGEDVRITWPLGTNEAEAAYWTFEAGVSEGGVEATLGEKMMMPLTIEPLGTVTISPAKGTQEAA